MSEARALGWRSVTALVAANMIGAGVFTTSGYALGDLGSREAVLWAWVVGGVIAVLGALSYGALAVRFPHSGGEYEFLRRTLHPAAGVVAGFVSLLAGFSAPIASAAHALEQYGFPLFGAEVPRWPWLGTLAILAAALAHGGKVALGARVQDAVVLAKAALIAVLLALGARALLGAEASTDAAAGTVPGVVFEWSAFAVTSLWVYLAYSGWNAAVYVAGEVRDAKRTVPSAMLAGTLLVTVAYVALNAVFVAAVPASELAGKAEVALIAANALLGRPGEVFAGVIVTLALVTSITAMLMAGPRVYARMAEDGALPAWFARTSADGAPRPAIALQAGLALVFLWVATLQELMTYIGWTLSLSAAATVVGLLVLRRREGAVAVPCRGGTVVPVAFVTVVTWFAVASFVRAPWESGMGLATVVVGLVLAGVWSRHDRSRSAGPQAGRR